MNSKNKKLYKNVMWFDKRIVVDAEFFKLLDAKREVSKDDRYKSGTFYSEKCQHLIQYESGLELDFIKQLEADKNVLLYCEQPITIKYYKGKMRKRYTPDFAILFVTGEVVMCEVKDLGSMLEDRVQLKAQGLIDYCSKKGFGFLLTDGNHTFDDLIKRLRKVKLNRKLEKDVLSAIKKHPVRRKEYNLIAKECIASHNDLLKIILKHDLRYNPFPFFKLREGKLNFVFRQVFVNKKRFDDLIEERYSTLFGNII